ncbi:hypothetical protein DFH08DRAFT_987948 [Mycena albidolilacea]|uniref:Uncharacterized protein n=1 Tax=Mycena albidolilacea TaxID=1033008 RepID=A0AAD7EVK8_9AGAR|nr:hypothetical protein DFH08DRAFT_987948 [Mycena albidolilacea]
MLGEVLDGLDVLDRLCEDFHLDLLARFLPEHCAVTRTHTFVPNGHARCRSGLLPVRRSYGDMGTVFFVGVQLRSHQSTERALGGSILLRSLMVVELVSRLLCRQVPVEWATSVLPPAVAPEVFDVDAVRAVRNNSSSSACCFEPCSPASSQHNSASTEPWHRHLPVHTSLLDVISPEPTVVADTDTDGDGDVDMATPASAPAAPIHHAGRGRVGDSSAIARPSPPAAECAPQYECLRCSSALLPTPTPIHSMPTLADSTLRWIRRPTCAQSTVPSPRASHRAPAHGTPLTPAPLPHCAPAALELSATVLKWADVLEWWQDLCAQHHQGGCPAFEPVIFTLNPPNSTHPSSAPCTTIAPAGPAVYVAAPAGTHYSGATRAAIAAAADPYLAPGRSTATAPVAPAPPPAPAVAAAPGPSAAAAPAPTGSPFVASPSDVKKEEVSSPTLHLNVPPRVNMNTWVQLTPTGQARADVLYAAAHSGACLVAQAEGLRVRDDRLNDITATPPPRRDYNGEDVERFHPAPRPSVLVTPVAPAAAPAVAPTPVPPAPPAAPVVQYGIRGVSVFYSSHAAALGAATRLALDNPRIMMTSNIEKLESWMRGDPFVGKDDA